jgi:hypothetical protein
MLRSQERTLVEGPRTVAASGLRQMILPRTGATSRRPVAARRLGWLLMLRRQVHSRYEALPVDDITDSATSKEEGSGAMTGYRLETKALIVRGSD